MTQLPDIEALLGLRAKLRQDHARIEQSILDIEYQIEIWERMVSAMKATSMPISYTDLERIRHEVEIEIRTDGTAKD